MREYVGFIAIRNGFEGAYRYSSGFEASDPEQAKRKLRTAVRQEAESRGETVREYLGQYLEMKLRPDDYIDLMVAPESNIHLEDIQIEEI